MVTYSPATAPDSAVTTPQQEPLPAGGPDPNRFDWAEAWHPIHYVEDLDQTRPNRFTLLGQDLVIWWDPQQQSWHVFPDRCPHRLAPLSEGRINEAGHLECPYHGWSFSGSGECQQIPQQFPDQQAHQSPRACATSLPTAIRQGLLFVYPGDVTRAAQVPVPIIDPLEDDPEGWIVLNTFRDLPYDALTLLENVLDSSHIPYTHHQTVGKRENAAPMAMEVLAADRQGFQGIWPEGPRQGKLGTQHSRFIAPGLMYHDLTSQQFGRTLTVVYAVPIGKGQCRLFARFPFKFSSRLPKLFIGLTPRWYTHIGNNRVLEDDQIFLHIQERALAQTGAKPYGQACYLPTQADRYVLQFRQWVSQFEADPFPGGALAPEWSQAELMDRYHSHTQHCHSCRSALKRIQQLRRGALGISAVTWSALPLVVALAGVPSLGAGAMLTLIPLVAAALWWWLGTWEHKLHRGHPIPARNQSS